MKIPKRLLAATLLELMVGLSVGILILALLVQAYQQVVKVWVQSEARHSLAREVETAAELLSRDLARVVSKGGIVSLSTQAVVDDTSERSDSSEGQLHLLISAKNDGLTDICAVSYRCLYDPSISGYGLYRFFFSSNQLFSRLQESQNSANPEHHQFEIRDEEENGERVAAYVWNFRPLLFAATIGGSEGEPVALVKDGTMPVLAQISFDAAAPTRERIARAAEMDRRYWHIPTSHFYQALVGTTARTIVREFALPHGWRTLPRPSPPIPPGHPRQRRGGP